METICHVYQVFLQLPITFGMSVHYEVLSFTCLTMKKASWVHSRVGMVLFWQSCNWYQLNFINKCPLLRQTSQCTSAMLLPMKLCYVEIYTYSYTMVNNCEHMLHTNDHSCDILAQHNSTIRGGQYRRECLTVLIAVVSHQHAEPIFMQNQYSEVTSLQQFSTNFAIPPSKCS